MMQSRDDQQASSSATATATATDAAPPIGSAAPCFTPDRRQGPAPFIVAPPSALSSAPCGQKPRPPHFDRVAKPLDGRRCRPAQHTTHAIYGARNTPAGLLFEQPLGQAQQMFIAGDFNDWNPHAAPMTADPTRGTWRLCLNLPPGQYRYRLVVDGRWMRDPYNTYIEANPYGEHNSVVVFNADD